MTPRLSPAQRRVVDAMRDGAELWSLNPGYRLFWRPEAPGGGGRYGGTVHGATAGSLIRSGIVVNHDSNKPYQWSLAPAYASALSAQTGAPDLMAALQASLAEDDRDGEA